MGFYFPCNFLEEYMLTLLEAILAVEVSRKQKSPVLPNQQPLKLRPIILSSPTTAGPGKNMPAIT